jgi:hypothetical protein
MRIAHERNRECRQFGSEKDQGKPETIKVKDRPSVGKSQTVTARGRRDDECRSGHQRQFVSRFTITLHLPIQKIRMDDSKGIFRLGHESNDVEPSAYQLAHSRVKVNDSTITQIILLIQRIKLSNREDDVWSNGFIEVIQDCMPSRRYWSS